MHYQYFFIGLRTIVILQTILVVSGKFSQQPTTRLILDSLIKLSIGSFLFFFFLLNEIPGIDPWDSLIIRFAGVVFMLSIDFKGLLSIVDKIYPGTSNGLSILTSLQTYPAN